ncbi:clathrin adaptor, mu subunit, partial [Kipferlia bialata]
DGRVVVKAFLSGMPECMFGFNERSMGTATTGPKQIGPGGGAKDGKKGIALDDCHFHQCVKLNQFEENRTISFVPPDGQFELMGYRITHGVQQPFLVTPLVTPLGRNRLEIKVSIRSAFPHHISASKVTCSIPCPENTATTTVNVTSGKAQFDPTKSCIQWRLRSFAGGHASQSLSVIVETIPGTSLKGANVEDSERGTVAGWKSRPPISLNYKVSMWAASGLEVRFLKVIEKSYKPLRWLRYETLAGDVVVRF